MGKKTGRPGNPKLDDETWVALLERYVRGETQAALGLEYGVSVSAIAWQARTKGYRKKDRPDAVYRWVQPPPIVAAAPADVACGFDFDPDDLEGSEARALEVARRAAAEGRSLDFVRSTQVVRATRRLKQKPASEAGASPLHHPSDGPVVGSHAILPPPPMGEDLAVPEPVLRAAQRPPEGDWTTWLFLGGRGAGKTLAGATWLSDMAEALGPGGRLALIGPTLHDVREVMIEGASGIASLARWHGVERPVFEPSRRRLVFPNGAVAHVFSAEDPDSLRGPQFSAAWADEMCAWRGAGETLALLRMGLRLAGPACGRAIARDAEPRCLSADAGAIARDAVARCLSAEGATPFPLDGGRVGDGGGGVDGEDRAHEAPSSDRASRASCGTGVPPPPPRPSPIEGEGAGRAWPPRLMISTTPRPTQALRALRAEPGLVETHAGTRDNAEHLAAGFVEGLERLYGGTRRAAQEIEGRVVEVEGALWTAEMLAACRGEVEGRFDRVVVALDPTTTAGGNACGIVAAGRCGEAAWVLADRSVAGVGPLEWARRAAALAEEMGAAAIVAEVNQGGDMVKAVLKAAGCAVPVKEVRATKGKRVRAEPVAALYEQGRVRHAAGLGRLEEELMAFGGEDGACDFDRADALVWAITDLLIDRTADGERGPRVRSLEGAPWRGGLSAPINLGIAGRGRGW